MKGIVSQPTECHEKVWDEQSVSNILLFFFLLNK